MTHWTIELEEDENGLILPLPTDLLDGVGWKVGDTIEWVDNEDGTWSLKKKELTPVLHIVQCSDSMMWYRDKVGQDVVFVREDAEYFWSRDNGGYLNIVLKKDAYLTRA